MADDLITDDQLLISLWSALAQLSAPGTTGFHTFSEASEAARAVADRLGDAPDPEGQMASCRVELGAYALQLAAQRPGRRVRAQLAEEALADFEIARTMLAAPERKSA